MKWLSRKTHRAPRTATERLFEGAGQLIAEAEPVHYPADPRGALLLLIEDIGHIADRLARDLEDQAQKPEVRRVYPELYERARGNRGAVILEAECFFLHAVDRFTFAILGASQREPLVDFVGMSTLRATFNNKAQPDWQLRYKSLEPTLLARMNARSEEYSLIQEIGHEPATWPGYLAGATMYKCASNMIEAADPQAAKDPLVTLPMTLHIGMLLKVLNIPEAVSTARGRSLMDLKGTN